MLENNAPFRSCITKINNLLIENAEDLCIVMLTYNRLEYIDNYYSMTGIIVEMKWMMSVIML